VHFYQLAAERGCAVAQCNLGICFEHGDGVAQNLAEAARYYRLAAAQEGAIPPEVLAGSLAACVRIASDRDVASACCLGCGARRKLKTCSKCKVARFCSTECVARAWPAHKPNCRLWRRDDDDDACAQ
jgi:hypothetical protein